MIEHEKKYLLRDTQNFESLIKGRGFTPYQTTYQKDIYFSRPDIDFMKTKECFRIRSEKTGIEITYKPPTTQSMSASQSIWKKEINLTVQNEDTARKLLLAIGSVELCTVEKNRKEFRRGNITVAIDNITGLGNFVEIEILSNIHDSVLIDKINQVSKELGLLEEDVINLPYRDLVMEYDMEHQ